MTEPNASPIETPANPVPQEGVVERVKRRGFFTPLMIDVIAGVSSIAAGAMTVWQMVEERAHKNLSSLGLIEDIKGRREKFGQKITGLREKGLYTEMHAASKIAKGSQLFEHKIDERFAEMGYGSFIKKLRVLRDHQYIGIGLAAVAFAGLAMTSVVYLARSAFTKEQLDEIDSKASGKNQSIQR